MCVTQLETVDKTGRYFTDSTFSTARPQDLLFQRAGERNGPEVVTCCSPPPSLPPSSHPLSRLGVICIDRSVQLNAEVIHWD